MINDNVLLRDRLTQCQQSCSLNDCEQKFHVQPELTVSLAFQSACLQEFFRIHPDMFRMAHLLASQENIDSRQLQRVRRKLKTFLDETVLTSCMAALANDLQA